MKTRALLCILLVFLAGAGSGAAKPNGMVVLLTDYGADSIYVGILKGAIYSKFPEAKVVTATNSVPPFDVLAGGHLLLEACGAFPRGTTFCCVVDPGVGTDRKCIVLETKAGQYFVSPDNGLLTLVAREYGVAQLHECSNKALWRAGSLSTTFHGRDIFGPVAASLASGVAIEDAGPELEKMIELDVPVSEVKQGAALGAVVRKDIYGNLVTNITRQQLQRLRIKRGDTLDITIGKAHYQATFVSAYGDVPTGERLVLVQSSGFVECAANMRSLSDEIAESQNAPVSIRKVIE